MRENNAYPPLFREKWPKHRIEQQKLYNLPFATIFITHIFADIFAKMTAEADAAYFKKLEEKKKKNN